MLVVWKHRHSLVFRPRTPVTHASSSIVVFVCTVLWLPSCHHLQGLLRLNTTSGQLEQLASRVADDGSAIAYANGVDIAANGSIFFTASTDITPARARDGSFDTGFAWVLSNFRGLPR